MMDLVDFLTLIGACVAVAAYVCRLDGLQFGKNQPSVIVMHGALCAACGSCAVRAWNGDAGLLEVTVVIGALAWIWVSLPSWKGGPPRHTETHPAPLDSRPHV